MTLIISIIIFLGGPLPPKMQQVSVPIINNTECEGMYRRAGYVEHIPDIFICAGYTEGKQDSCEVCANHRTTYETYLYNHLYTINESL